MDKRHQRRLEFCRKEGFEAQKCGKSLLDNPYTGEYAVEEKAHWEYGFSTSERGKEFW